VKIVQPPGWRRPSGYANGVIANGGGRVLAVSGQIGWNPATETFETDEMAAQARQALDNLVVVLHAAGAAARDVVRLTWYVTDRADYVASRREIGEAYRELFGDHYPAMSVVVVAGLLDRRAKVEIEATAVLSP
jgi:enamine deaminase RidA (YjgF/YER057c/UK114 family)